MYAAGFDLNGGPLWDQRYGSTRPDLIVNAVLAPQGDVVECVDAAIHSLSRHEHHSVRLSE